MTGHALDLGILDGLDHDIVSDPVRSDLADNFGVGWGADKECSDERSCEQPRKCRSSSHRRLRLTA
jgi:hypothetical protein